jgi:hypothetical protein
VLACAGRPLALTRVGDTIGNVGIGARAALATLLAAPACLPPGSDVLAQEAGVSPSSAFNWAYAATLGTGFYELGDATDILVIRAPIKWTLRKPGRSEGDPFGIKLLFPVTVGVERFDFDTLFGGGLPHRFEQVSFLPGVELEFPMTERWRLKGRAQAGWGTELGSGDERAVLYAFGLRSRYEFPEAAGHPAWISGLLWSGYNPSLGAPESLAKLSNGVEFDLTLERWRFRGERMHLAPHLLGDWYFNTADFFSFDDDVFRQLDWEWEVGLAAGRDEPFSIFGKAIDRFGFALRYSHDSAGIRFFLNSIF